MKKLILFLVSVTFLCLIAGLVLISRDSSKLVSPVLGISKKIKIADNVWFPKILQDRFLNTNDGPNITADAAFFIETNTGEVLYQKNPKQKLPIASLVKIMTAIITLENRSFDDLMVVSEHAASMEPDHMILKPFEKLTVKEFLDGLFLVSANDAAEVLAENTTGQREEFISLMNLKAAQLGMLDSKFLNPTGLEEDFDQQYSTAFDVSLMARYALKKWPQLLEITSQPHIYIEQTDSHQDYDLYNGINLITTYPGVVGFKTGFTPEAGLTLVTVAQKEGKEVLGVILGATNRRDDAKELLDYSFKKLAVI